MVQTGWSKQAVLKYLLLQIPAVLLFAGLLWLLHGWIGLPPWAAWTLLAIWVVKDAVLFFFVWPAYEQPGETDTFSLLGLSGTARDRLDPEGLVKVRGEIWRARLAEGQPRIEAGGRITVVARKGLTLLVQSEAANRKPDPSAHGKQNTRGASGSDP